MTSKNNHKISVSFAQESEREEICKLLIIPIYAKVPKSLLNLSSLKEIVPKKKLSSWSCLANLHISSRSLSCAKDTLIL
jgi:hypothetical protein